TPPKARSAELVPGNLLEVQVIEGGAVKSVKARIVRTADPSFEVEVELNDTGIGGDRIAQDTIFSAVVPDLPAGAYRAIVEMTDGTGNAGTDTFDLRRRE
ncbi:MAG TPA: choice-of-anchor X domain-containing protein, partial [Acidobacteriota bacterium]|nr:choice-of-anchor X domain-containing protein [Acidobacteriota bacterium]